RASYRRARAARCQARTDGPEPSKTASGQAEHQSQDVVAAAQKCVPGTRSPGIILASSQTAIVRASGSSITSQLSANAYPLMAQSGHAEKRNRCRYWG